MDWLIKATYGIPVEGIPVISKVPKYTIMHYNTSLIGWLMGHPTTYSTYYKHLVSTNNK